MTLTRVFVQDRQYPQRPAPHSSIGYEVPGPHVIAMRRRGGQARRNPAPNDLSFGGRHA